MLKGIYHSDRGEHSALLIVSDPVGMLNEPVYVRRSFVQENKLNIGDSMVIPAGYKVVNWKEVELESGTTVMLKTLGL